MQVITSTLKHLGVAWLVVILTVVAPLRLLAQPNGSNMSNPVVMGSYGTGSYNYTDTKNNDPANGYLNDYGQGSDDIYYRFTVQANAQVDISLCGSNFDTYLHLLDANGNLVAEDDDNGPLCSGLQSSLSTSISPGTYYIVVEGYGGNYGDINMAANLVVQSGSGNNNPPANTQPINLSKPVGSPKGSGASNGAGGVSYSIPIEVLPGVNGLQPSIALNYSSQAGDGNFGYGWNLSTVSSISRAGKNNYYNGIAAPVSYTNANDAFVLDGQRLFPISGNNGDNGTVYGTENEGFAKIESFGGSATSGPTWFKVTTKDGKVMEYSNGGATTLWTDNTYQGAMVWLLNKVTDINGNYETFTYSINNTDRNYVLTEIDYTGNTPNSIAPNTKVIFSYTVKPYWPKTKIYQSGYSIASPFLLDKISVINPNGSTVKSYQCAYSVLHDQSFLQSFTEIGADGTTLNPLQFTYGTNTTALDVAISPSYGQFNYNNTFTGDITGDGKEDVIAAYLYYDNNNIAHYTSYYVFDNFGTYNGQAALSPAYSYPIPAATASDRTAGIRSAGGYYNFITSDYDGDTKRDVLMTNWRISGSDMTFSHVSINYSRYYGAVTGNTYQTVDYNTPARNYQYTDDFAYSYRNGSTFGTNFIPGDFDGDGAQDYILILGLNSSNAFKAFFNSPKKGIFNQEIMNFGVEGNPSDPFYATSVASATDVVPIDFNGDGKTEILVQKANYSYVLSVYPLPPSSGASFGAQVLYSTSDIKSGYRVFPGDFNGDGNTDLLVRSSKTDPNAAWNLLYSTGTAFRSYPFLYSRRPTLDGDAGGYTNVNMLMVGDFNGDGKSDIWQSLDDASGGLHSVHVLYYSNGIPVDGGNSTSAFTIETYTRPESINKSFSTQNIIGDINGDGKPDLMSLLGTNSRIIYPKPFKEDRLMASAVDGFGSVTSFGYSLMNSNSNYQRSYQYEYDNPGSSPTLGQNGVVYNVLKFPMYLLTEIDAPDGIGGTTSSTYAYQDAVYSPIRGFLGFKQISESTPSGTNTTFSEIDPTLLVPHTVRQLSMYGSDMLTDTKITDELLPFNTTYFDKRYVHHINSTLALNGLTGSAMQSDNTYDSYGNITANTTKKGYLSGTSVIAAETTVTTTTLGMHGTPVPALPESITSSITRSGQSTVNKTNTYSYTNAGLLASSVDFAGTANAVTSSYTYDNFGNVTTVSVNAPNTTTPNVTNTYDNTGRFLVKKETTGSGITKTETYSYEPVWGQLATSISSDGLSTNYTYDNSFGRWVKTTLPDGNGITQTMAWETAGNNRYSIALQRDADAGLYTKEYHDYLGRKVKTEKRGFGGQLLTSVTNYDYRGQVVSQTAPYYPSETPIVTSNTYDGYGRPTVSSNGTSSASISYSQLGNGQYQITTTNGAGQASSKTQDGAGKVVGSNDNGGQLDFTYDSWGNQLSVTLGGNTLVSNVYDAYGRQTSLTDKNAGTIAYEYNTLGKLTKQTDANGNIYTMLYDAFGRTTNKNGPEGTTSFEYFTNGSLCNDKPTKITGPSGDITEYTYDNLVRLSTKKTTMDGTSYIDQYAYDSYSNLIKTTYASGIAINDTYDNNGTPISTTLEDGGTIRNIFTASAMNSKGIYTGYTLGNGLASQIDYNLALGVPARFYTPGIQDLNMTWDAQRGNLDSRSDAIRNLAETFSYDNLNRLTGTSINNSQQISLSYDNGNGYSLGNIASKTDAGNYVYRTDKTNAVAFISNPAGAQVQPSVISTQTQNLTYTPFLKTASIDQNGYHLDYTYGSDQQRIKSVLKQYGNTIDTKYYLGTYERQIIPAVADRYIHYINAGNGIAAIAVKENGVTNLFFVYSDHLGSILTLTDVNGNTVAKQNFDAWGRYRNPDDWTYNNIPTNNPSWLYRGYTGHEQLNTFALINMNGRMYDPIQGRMLSPDNYVPLPWNTQGYNKYGYANNNPLVYTDPDGNVFGLDDLILGTLGGIINLGTHLISGNVSWGQAFGYFGVGFAAGVAVEYGGPFASGAILGAGNAWVGGGSISDIAKGAIVGGITSYFTAGIGNVVNGSGIINGAINNAVKGAIGGGVGGATQSLLNGDDLGTTINNTIKGSLSGAASGTVIGGIQGGIEAHIQGKNILTGKDLKPIYKTNIKVGPLTEGEIVYDNNPKSWEGTISKVTKDADGNQTIYQASVQFGGDENQVYHAFRHTDDFGLNRSDVSSAIVQDLAHRGQSIVPLAPSVQFQVNISGVPVIYSVFKFQSGVINVGSIRPPR